MSGRPTPCSAAGMCVSSVCGMWSRVTMNRPERWRDAIHHAQAACLEVECCWVDDARQWVNCHHRFALKTLPAFGGVLPGASHCSSRKCCTWASFGVLHAAPGDPLETA